MEIPLQELIDRYTIAKLRVERIGGKEFLRELREYEKGLMDLKNKNIVIDERLINDLYEINGKIWDNWHLIRMGGGSELSLSEIGKRFLKTRDLNKKRISIKNEIVRKTGKGFLDIEMNEKPVSSNSS